MEYIYIPRRQAVLMDADGEGLPLLEQDEPDLPPANIHAWMSEARIIQVLDVNDRYTWVSERHYLAGNILVPICNMKGVHREHTKAGQDGHNYLHRENIVKIRNRKTIT